MYRILAHAPRFARGFLVVTTLLISGCGADDPASTPTGPEDPGTTGPGAYPPLLLDESQLTAGLFGWPETDFSRGNSATIEIFRHTGSPAVDFTLTDLQGEPVRLAELLRARPVLLVLGSYT